MSAGGALRILLVEDDLLIALSMEMELRDAGYSVPKRVATGEKAVLAAREESPDVILMDIRLAGDIDGVDAALGIREFSDVPIIFMTGYQDDGTEERARAVNPLAYLIKPAGLREIRDLLDTIVPRV